MAEKRKKIGRYTITGKLGKGGMGSVYRAASPVTGKTVALKVLDPFEILMETVGEDELKKIFTAEAVLMAQLHNPYIAEVWDFDYDEKGLPFFTMDYYCNNLGTMIGESYDTEKKSRLIAPEKAIQYGSQILQGLSCLHSAGIIHRDIKPYNIMISDLDDVKICDFGLSKIRGERFSEAASGMRIGSPFYAAPEQVHEPESADERSDLYSVGVLLFRMLTGELPSMKNISVSIVNHLYDEKWDSFFSRCLGLSKESRFGSASEMLYALKHLSLHWENVKERQCALTPPEEESGQDHRIALRSEPEQKAGRHARSCFAVDSLARPLKHIQNNFQKRDGFTVFDKVTSLVWQTGGSDNPVDRKGADRYVAGLNEMKFAGINSWRLPTVNELISLFDSTGNMEQYCRPDVFDPEQVRLWSCDRRSETTAWYVNTELEFVGWQDENCFYYVRAVSTAI